MLSLVRTIRHEELKDLHSLLSNNLYTRPNRLVGAAAVDFALKARRAIEQVLGHREGLHVSPSLAASHAMPNISDIRRDIGHLPPLPADLSGRLPPVPLSQPSSTPATQPAFQPLRSPLLGDLLGTSAPQPLGARSAPLFPHTSPPGSLPGSQMPSFHLEDASSSDPVLFEDSRITTVFEEASPFPSPGSFSVDPFRASTSAAPASAPQPVQSYPAGSQSTNPTSLPPPASPLLSPTAVPRFLPIRYYDANLGKFLEWRAFQGWLWQAPHTIDSAMDYHGESVQPQSVVTVVAQFAGLDDIQRQAILDHVSLPSRAPALLRQAVVGDKLRVLQLFSIRGTTWLACVPFEGGKPGFIPL